MKQTMLILFMCCLLNATQRTWNGTDFGGTIGSTDTLVWDGTSVVNWTATGNMVCGHAEIKSTYSGNWTMTGYTLTLTNGGLLRSGSGTFTLGNGLTFNGNGKLYMNATSGTNSSATSCIVTFNGVDTAQIDKSISVKSVVINSSLNNIGSVSFVMIYSTGTIPFVMPAHSLLYGPGNMQVRAAANCTIFSIDPTATVDLSGSFLIYGINNTGSTYTFTIPKMTARKATLSLSTLQTGGATFNITGELSFNSISVTTGSSCLDGVTANTNNYLIKAPSITVGSNKTGTKLTVNLGSSEVRAYNFTTSTNNSDSTIFNSSGALFNIAYRWSHGSNEKINGSYATATVNDLFMGHSILGAVGTVPPPTWLYSDEYSNRNFKNRGLGGSKIDNIASRIDSCLTAYTPKRFFMWTGTNDLNFDDATKFDSAVAWYFTYWPQIIAKVKAAHIDSIYIVDMPPRHDVGYMSATKQANFKRFNAALKDSAFKNGCYFIETYDSLLAPGYTDRMNTAYTTDGLHPNSTLVGAEYCGYLFSLAQKQKLNTKQSTKRFSNKFGFGF